MAILKRLYAFCETFCVVSNIKDKTLFDFVIGIELDLSLVYSIAGSK